MEIGRPVQQLADVKDRPSYTMLFSGFQLNTVTLGTQRRSTYSILLIFGDGEGSGGWGSVEVGVGASLVSNDHRVHRVVTSAFWRTFSHESKIRLGW
jgi:hypothetical protein